MNVRTRVPRTSIEPEAARNAIRLSRDVGDSLRTMCEDAGLSIGRLARVCGLSKCHIHDIENARIEASHEVVATRSPRRVG